MARPMLILRVMKNVRATFLILAALTLASVSSLLAQRRTTDGGGSSGRSAPSSGGSGSASGGQRSSGGGRAAPASSPRSGGSTQASSGSGASRPTSGKIGALKRSAAAARAGGGTVIIQRGVYLGGCWDCNYWGFYHGYYGWYHGGWWYPSYYPPREVEDNGSAEPGQGYQPYPYAENDGTGSTFVQQHSMERPSFGTISGNFFSDVGSTTRAGQFAIEGAYRQVRGEIEYGAYSEPLATTTDHLQTLRFGAGWQPRLGNSGYLVAGVAARGVFLDDGSDAWGPEGELGVQLLPKRPFGLNVTGRLAAMSWNGSYGNYFTLREVNTTGSLFIGRIELQAGWHWLKMGSDPAFAGPVVGTRLWF